MEMNDNLGTVMSSSATGKILLIQKYTHTDKETKEKWQAIEILFDLPCNNVKKLWYNADNMEGRNKDFADLKRKVY